MKNCTIVIPNYNGVALLTKYLPSVLTNCKEAEILIVDDASSDSSVKMLHDDFPNIKVIVHSENTGFSETVNDGFKEAKGEFVLLLNSDVSLEENIIPKLLKYFDDPEVFGVGCLQHTVTDQGKMEEGSGAGIFQKGFLAHRKGDVLKGKTLWIFGGAGMFRKSIWAKLGGLEKLYEPFYWEDIDISYRALKSGFKILFDPKVSILHHRIGSSISSFHFTEEITTVSYRNQYFFVWLNISDRNLIFQHLFYIPLHFIRSIFTFNSAYLNGFFQAVRFLPKILRQRNRYANLWKRSDDEILTEYGGN